MVQQAIYKGLVSKLSIGLNIYIYNSLHELKYNNYIANIAKIQAHACTQLILNVFLACIWNFSVKLLNSICVDQDMYVNLSCSHTLYTYLYTIYAIRIVTYGSRSETILEQLNKAGLKLKNQSSTTLV